MADLTMRYMGIALKNPLISSASPLSEDLDKIRKAEEAGASAVILHSLFEEQVTLEERTLNGARIWCRKAPSCSASRSGTAACRKREAIQASLLFSRSARRSFCCMKA